jgi:hypothetical protein
MDSCSNGADCGFVILNPFNGGARDMDPATVHKLRNAVNAAKHAAHQAKMENCDVDDIDEAIEAVDHELLRPHPNKNTLTLYLNSLARSLIAVQSAREAREEIDDALRLAGLPSTWEQ